MIRPFVSALRARASLLAIFLVMLTWFTSANAFDPEWEWRALNQSFPTKQQAEAHVWSSGNVDARYPYLTKEKRLLPAGEVERYEYSAPKIAPDLSDWVYYDGLYSSELASEAAWVADRLARYPSDSRCPAKFMTPEEEWRNTSTNAAGIVTHQARKYMRHGYSYFDLPEGPECRESNASITVMRRRTATCPPPYVGDGSPPGCEINLTTTITGKRNYRECPAGADSGDRGNPCNAITGDKHETAVDYSGPGGLKLVRNYHSRSLDGLKRLGEGWSHNFQATAGPVNGSIVEGITRPDGYRESLEPIGSSTSNNVSTAGNGLIVKEIGTTEIRVYRNDGGIEVYDAINGRLLQDIGPTGLVTTLTYNGSLLETVTGPFGHTLQFQYGSDGRLTQVLDPAGEAIIYSYTGRNLTSVSYPDGRTRTYHYENTSFPSFLTGVTDEDGVRLSTFAYDTSGRAISTEHAGGVNKYTFAYNATNSVVTDPLGTQETIAFTTEAGFSRRVKKVTKDGKSVTYTMPSPFQDDQRRISQVTDAKGYITKFTYNTYGMTSKTEAFGTSLARTTSYTYLNNDSDLPTLITEPNRTTAFTYGTNNVLLTRTITDTATSVSRTWTYTYNSAGQVLTADGPRTDVSDVTTYTYYNCTTGDECGQLHTITNALGHVTTYNSYNAHGQPLQITDPNGVLTTLTYDLRQRLTSRTVDGETTTLEYWPTGLLKKVTLPDTSYVQYTYDDAHRLTQIADGEGNRVVYTLDNMGNRTKEQTFDPSDALVRLHHRAFNSLNQLWKEIGSANTAAVTTTFGYDNNGNQTSAAAPLSRSTASLYDELNRLKQITDAASGITQFGYDANDNLTSVTDPRGKVTSYVYNGFGEVTQLTSPDTGVSTSTYDPAGNLATATDARSKVGTYTYDALNRLTQLSYSDQTIAYTYDTGTNNKGRLMQVTDNSGSTDWTYTNEGRTASRTQTMGSVVKTVAYGYNSAGQLNSITTPSGQVIAYSYLNNRISGITVNGATLLTNALYDPFGPARQWDWGNGTLSVRSFDQDGNVELVDSSGLKSYGYDDAFRITGITDGSDPNLSWTYGYDSLDRLTSASKTGQSQTWTYDANGNRLTQGGTTSSTFTVSTTSNRLNRVSGALSRTYNYDAAGNTTGYAGLTFTYNDAGRMVGVSGGASASYAHNALGQRVKKVVGSTTTYFVYDEGGHFIGEYDGAGALIQEIVWFGDTPVASLKNSGGAVTPFYIHTDHLDTPRKITRTSDNAILWRWDSDPFGIDVANEDADGDTVAFAFNLRFPGQYYDAETGLNYNYFRDYDPTIGKYTESDPIGLEGGINTYTYVGGAPVAHSDTFGLAEWWDQLRGVGPFDAARARNDANTALERSRQSGLPGMHNGAADAFRHCLWSCLMTQSIGADQAKIVGDTHETVGNKGGQPKAEEQMDKANNAVGRQCGLMTDEFSCSVRCKRKYDRWALFGLGGKQLPAPPRRPHR